MLNDIGKVDNGMITQDKLRQCELACVLHTGQPYGSGRSTVEHVQCVRDFFRSVSVFLSEDGPLVGELEKAGAMCHVIPFEHRGLRRKLVSGRLWRDLRDVALSRCRFVKLLTRHLSSRNAIVHVQSSVCTYGILAALLAKRPMVVHLREMRRPGLERWVREQWTAWGASRVIAVSHGVLTGYGERLRRKARVVYNFVDIPALQPRERPSVCPVVGFVGSVHFEKGIREFLEVCRNLVRSGYKFEGRVYGKFLTPDCERWCTDFVKRHELSRWVGFMGERYDTADIYGGLDILVHPTYFDALPRAVMEAMAWGVPVVATRVGGIPEMVGDQWEGLVPVGDSVALEAAIGRLLEDDEKRLRLGRVLQDRARQLFGRDRYTKELLSIYCELLQTRNYLNG